MKTETIVLLIVVLGAHSLLVLGDCLFGGMNLKAEESYSLPGECVQFTCQAGGAMTGKICPSVGSLRWPCKMVEDTKKPFPLCCPYIDCGEKDLRL
ncbi:hypothetical protein AWZ03_012868 [Drosophila navojoa]|uniref:Single domain-containing protein n=1 Tax=Drosophila navojoa TaxID=7232 RepID=A0A484AYM5_DRONA|nr:uncharacterized protein LOC115564624 [Drosophila navojoa]TDG40711.1 hypothetical protein AWZ03_012868 [Drosophila navojoa]